MSDRSRIPDEMADEVMEGVLAESDDATSPSITPIAAFWAQGVDNEADDSDVTESQYGTADHLWELFPLKS